MALPVKESAFKKKKLSKQRREWALFTLQGFSDRDAAIKVGISESSASTIASRWNQEPEVQEFLRDLYESQLLAHQKVIANVIDVWRTILNDKATSAKNKLEAGRLLKEFYEKMTQEDLIKLLMGDDGADNAPYKTLIEYIQNPLPTRTLDHFRREGQSDSIEQ